MPCNGRRCSSSTVIGRGGVTSVHDTGVRGLLEPQPDAAVARGKSHQDARLGSRAQQQVRGDRPVAQETVEVAALRRCERRGTGARMRGSACAASTRDRLQ